MRLVECAEEFGFDGCEGGERVSVEEGGGFAVFEAERYGRWCGLGGRHYGLR